jgi:asparagine synthase (glutamine-hydrolysing)
VCGVYFRGNSNLEEHVTQDDKERLAKSNHRGPDSSTILVFENKIYGFNRLAIRDISGGDQPYFSTQGDLIACINGELYNEAYIRERLRVIRPDVTLPSGDMQVLAEYIGVYGSAGLVELEGIFAGFIYFLKRNSVLLFRDKIGEKPLYYKLDESEVCIASEIRCLIHPKQDLNLGDKHSIITGNWPNSETFYLGISKVLPGSSITIDLETRALSSIKYWGWDYSENKNIKKRTTSIIKQIDDAIQKSVTQQLVSDVPVAAFLSGGLDSALVLSMIKRVNGSTLDSFTLDFEDSGFSEMNLARQSAQYLESNHTIIKLKASDISELIPRVLKSMDSPIFDPACLGIYALSQRVAKKGFKVAISGDGGDELFRGYQAFRYNNMLSNLTAFPSLAQMLLRGIIFFGGKKDNYLGVQMLSKRAQDIFRHPELSIPEIALSPFAGTQLLDILSTPGPNLKRGHSSKLRLDRDFEKYYRNVVLPEVYLIKADQMSMANSLEIRNPLLDSNVINLINEFRRSGHQLPNKRQIMQSLLGIEFPSDVLRAKKHGFSIPLSQALTQMDEPSWNLKLIGIPSKEASKSWTALKRGDQSQSHSVWALLVLNEFMNR